MKKLYTKNKYKKYNKKRALDRLKRKLAHKKWRKNQQRSLHGKSKPKKRKSNAAKIEAPIYFSFINYSEDAIKFVKNLEECFTKRKQVFIDLQNIKVLDYSAITLLVSIMFEFKKKKIPFNGNYPKDRHLRKILYNSGFLKNLNKPVGNKIDYTVGKPNQILTRGKTKVHPELVGVVMEEVSKTILNKKSTFVGLHRVLIELMQNTHSHASLGKNRPSFWWLSVNHNKVLKKVSFTFIDYGIGIFESLKKKPSSNKFYGAYDKLLKLCTLKNNSEILKKILDGELHSTVTGQHFRGKGLPGIKEVFTRKQIHNLCIISNNVLANVASNHYKLMSTNFRGTLVTWELNQESEVKKWVL